MASIVINGKEYNTDELSQEIKNNTVPLICAEKIRRLEAQIAVYKTTEIAYSKVLESSLVINNHL